MPLFFALLSVVHSLHYLIVLSQYVYYPPPPSRLQRSSNIELLRIVAMLFIMLLHLNRENLGFPTESIFVERPVYALLWSWLRTINLTGVNVFILISGYFAIRPRVNSVLSLFFQGVFLLSWIVCRMGANEEDYLFFGSAVNESQADEGILILWWLCVANAPCAGA